MQFRCSVPLGFRVALWKSRPCFAWLRRRGIQAVLLRGAVSDLDGVGSILCFLLLGYSPIRFRGSHRSSGSVCRVFCRHVQRALRWWHILSPGIVSGWARQLVRSFSSLFFGPLRSGQAARPMRASQAGFRVGLLSGQLRAFRVFTSIVSIGHYTAQRILASSRGHSVAVGIAAVGTAA